MFSVSSEKLHSDSWNVILESDVNYKIYKNVLLGSDVNYKNVLLGSDVNYKIYKNVLLGSDVNYKIHKNVLLGSDVNYKIDTGAQVNVLPKNECVKLLRRPKLKPTKIKLSAYNGQGIPVIGKCILQITHKTNKTVPVLFIVADTEGPPILGLSTSEKLNLVKRIMKVRKFKGNDPEFVMKTITKVRKFKGNDTEFVKEFKDCFGELGNLPQTHHIEIYSSVSPVVQTQRRVLVALRSQLKTELDKMEWLEIIRKVDKPRS